MDGSATGSIRCQGVVVNKIKTLLAIGLAGCGTSDASGPIGLPVLVPIVEPVYVTTAGLLDTSGLLEGNWVISDAAGARSCLVIQEQRVSIIDVSCSSDGSGVSSRIIEGPIITRAGNVIVLQVTYNLRAAPERRLRLIFTGELQPDGSFIGSRRDEDLIAETVIPDRFATMSRS